jgi:glycine/D-amino acid oxidase-like deaminating enzyme
MSNGNLPTPDFNFTPPLNCIAGLRPYRDRTYRLEPQTQSGKYIVHNYGHGGAGITLSWGCAAQVRDIVRAHFATSADRQIAVLGSGVMGLTAATMLAALDGASVTIYAQDFWKDTTSRKAGGQWAASIVEYEDEAQFRAILETSYKTFKASIANGFGVSERPNYTKSPSHNLEIVLQLSPHLIPPRQDLQRMPFEGHNYPGHVYQTLLIEPPIFLPKLDADLRARGVQFVPKTFSGIADVLALRERIVINCTGLGSKKLWPDPALRPIKGQLALLPAQPALQYLYGQDGYLFPRADAVVIGGSYEENFTSPDPDPDFCKLLVDYMKGLFGKGPRIPIPKEHIHSPTNLPKIAPRTTGV